MKRDTTLINQHENKLPPNIMISNNSNESKITSENINLECEIKVH
jgi:hypothetical protein